MISVFFSPQNMATLGPFVPKAFFVDGALPFFFSPSGQNWCQKKRKKEKKTTLIGKLMVTKCEYIIGQSLSLFIYLFN